MARFKKGILLAATKDSAFVLGSLLVNITEKMPCVNVFYIVHDGFSEADKKAMEKIASLGGGICKFHFFDEQIFLEKLKKFDTKLNSLKQNQAFLQRYTFMAYAMFEALLFLQECESILYLDFDVLLLKNIEELFDYKNLSAHEGKIRLHEALLNYTGEFKDKSIVRTGTVLFGKNLANQALKLYDFIYESSVKYGFLNDQIAFSLLVYHFKLRFKEIDRKLYVGEVFYRKNRNAKLIHADGKNNRFWNNALTHRLFPQWQACYETWLKYGGSAYLQGFKAKTTYSKQRVRWHLSYKLGYAMIQASKSFKALCYLPFKLIYISLYHKIEQKLYLKELKTKPYLKLPALKDYEDYELGAKKEFQSLSYKLGSAFIKACKT